MRGVSPSQTLPIAGGQPPTPPGSVSPLHHDQRPALDSLKHHTPYRQPASALPLPAPPRLVPHTLRRRHTIQQYERDAMLPTEPRIPSCTHAKTPADRPAHHWAARRPDLRPRFARPRPLLAPPKRTDCRSRQSVPTSTPAAAAERPRIPHSGGGIGGRRQLAAICRRIAAVSGALIHFPQCRNLGPRHQCKFTLKKMFRPAHTPLLVDDHLEIGRYMPPDRHCMPQNHRSMPQN